MSSQRYQEFISERTRLLEHIKELEAENAELKKRLGELLMFGVLAQLPALISAVRNGKSIKLTKGDFTAEMSSSQGQGRVERGSFTLTLSQNRA